MWLVSSGGRRGALVKILQSLDAGDHRVLVTDASELSAAGRLADEFVTVPRISDPGFVPSLLKLCRDFEIEMIVPTLDPELSVYAETRSRFLEQGTDVLISRPEVTRLSWDKWKFANWLRMNDLPAPVTFQASDFAPEILPSRVVAKPRNGSASVGVLFATEAKDLPLEKLTDDYIIQSRVEGIEFTVDFAVDSIGQFLGAVPRRRLEVRAGEVSKGVTVRVPQVIELVEKLAKALPGAYGILNTQVFFDPETGDLSIIELNARVGGGYPLSDRAGADFFTALATHNPIEDWQDGLVMLRYDDAAYFESDEYGVS